MVFILPSLALVLGLFIQACSGQDNQDNEDSQYGKPFPQTVIDYMATRTMRYHHFFWHQIRDGWNGFDRNTKEAFRELGWEPPNPSRDSDGDFIYDNYAGEDFLYMHRHMIEIANKIISDHNDSYGPVTGWKTLPAPDDPDYPVPPSYLDYGYYKTDRHYYNEIREEERRFTDPDVLRRMTLNELGTEIEAGIHTSMHFRWSEAQSIGYRRGNQVVDEDVPYVSRRFDNPEYNWLVDTYSAHVNPLFWKLHGWIDARVEDWRIANGLDSIRWKGTWIGGPMSRLGSTVRKQAGMMSLGMGMSMSSPSTSSDDPEAVGDVLEKVEKIFMKSGVPESTLRRKNKTYKHCRKNKPHM